MAFVRLEPRKIAQRNHVVVAPTGSGKTYAMIQASGPLVREYGYRRVIFALPTKALTAEVYQRLVDKYGSKSVGRSDSDARIIDQKAYQGAWRRPFIVTTYEKLDSVIIANTRILDNAVIVIDEVHNATDPQRALPIIDIMAFARMRGSRVVVMSATMPEMERLAEYLDAELVTHQERSVKLSVETKEAVPHYWGRSAIYYSARGKTIRGMISSGELDMDRDAPILVYLPSRRWSEWLANDINHAMGIGFFNEVKIKSAIEKGEPVEWPLAVPHHAGLSITVRRAIEEEVRKKDSRIKVVVATDTLVQGVNMNFKTVIVSSLHRWAKTGPVPVETVRVQQVMGRAGRPEYHQEGRAIIIYTPGYEDYIVERILNNELESIPDLYDMPALVARLAYKGIDIDTWSKYAYKVNPDGVAHGRRVLEDTGLMSSGKLTGLGDIYAMEYLPGSSIPALLAVARAANDVVKGNDPLYAALGLSLLLARPIYTSTWNDKVVSDAMLEFANHASEGESVVNRLYDIYDQTIYHHVNDVLNGIDAWDVLRASGLEPEASSSSLFGHPTDFYMLASANGNGYAEAMRKAAITLQSLALAGIAPGILLIPGIALVDLMDSYRMLATAGATGTGVKHVVTQLLDVESKKRLVKRAAKNAARVLSLYDRRSAHSVKVSSGGRVALRGS